MGIGTVNPGSYKLAIAGQIAAWGEVKALNANTAFPDYVLLPLPEVEQYIKLNYHLPEVPSAKKVETEGIGIVKMHTIAIKKIEELTLHLIEQNKQLSALQKRQAQLERENQAWQQQLRQLNK